MSSSPPWGKARARGGSRQKGQGGRQVSGNGALAGATALHPCIVLHGTPARTSAARSMRRPFFSSFRSVLRSVLSAPAPGFFPVFFLRLSLRGGSTAMESDARAACSGATLVLQQAASRQQAAAG